MSSLKVAAAQIECRPGDVSANLGLHLAAIDEARGLGVDVLVFPELSLTDYLTAPDVPTLALASSAAELERLAEAAGPVTVAVGFIEEANGAQFYNAQAILGGGRVLHVHRKINLATYGRLEEGKHYAPGRRIDVFSLQHPWTAAALVCADTWNPALPWLAALGGASLLLVPVASSVDAVADDFDNPGGVGCQPAPHRSHLRPADRHGQSLRKPRRRAVLGRLLHSRRWWSRTGARRHGIGPDHRRDRLSRRPSGAIASSDGAQCGSGSDPQRARPASTRRPTFMSRASP